MSPNTVELVHKLDDMPPQKFEYLLPYKDYSRKDIEEAADLLK